MSIRAADSRKCSADRASQKSSLHAFDDWCETSSLLPGMPWSLNRAVLEIAEYVRIKPGTLGDPGTGWMWETLGASRPIIVLLGCTGAGKSAFIEAVTGLATSASTDGVNVARPATSGPECIRTLVVSIDDCQQTLLDVPEFDTNTTVWTVMRLLGEGAEGTREFVGIVFTHQDDLLDQLWCLPSNAKVVTVITGWDARSGTSSMETTTLMQGEWLQTVLTAQIAHEGLALGVLRHVLRVLHSLPNQPTQIELDESVGTLTTLRQYLRLPWSRRYSLNLNERAGVNFAERARSCQAQVEAALDRQRAQAQQDEQYARSLRQQHSPEAPLAEEQDHLQWTNHISTNLTKAEASVSDRISGMNNEGDGVAQEQIKRKAQGYSRTLREKPEQAAKEAREELQVLAEEDKEEKLRSVVLGRKQATRVYPEMRSHHDTRIITIESTGRSEDDIVCTSKSVAFHENLNYVALSYHWSSETSTADISINGNRLQVRRSLFEALKALETRGITQLWVDYLSIDQSEDNVDDKNRQIAKMSVIFCRATHVYAWVGPASGTAYTDTDVSMGVLFLGRINLDRRSPNDEEVKSVLNLVGRPYWRRCWVIQELCRAKKVTILCGSSEAEYERFSDNLDELWEELDSFAKRERIHLDDIRDHFDSLRAFQEQESAQSRSPQMSLIEALLLSRHSQVAIKRDKIFAIRDLAHDGRRLVDDPNYTLSDAETFQGIASGMIHLQGHVAIILLARRRRTMVLRGHGRGQDPLPSWVPEWSALSAILPEWIYQSLSQKQSKAPSASVERTVLSIRGVGLETVAATSGMPGRPRLSAPQTSEGEAAARPYFSTALEVLRKLRTALLAPLFTENGPHGIPSAKHDCGRTDCVGKSIDYYATASVLVNARRHGNIRGTIAEWMSANNSLRAGSEFLRCWLDDILLSDRQTARENPLAKLFSARKRWQRKAHSGPEYACDFATEAELLANALSTLDKYDMRLAVTSRHEIRAVYCETQPGDKICRLDGCSLPVVLRPKPSSVPRQYLYVGEVYLHGHLDEGFVGSDTGWRDHMFLEDEWIDIRLV